MINVISPDRLPITPRGFRTRAAAEAGRDRWIQRFAAQGYYAAANGERIALADLSARCELHDARIVFAAPRLCPECGATLQRLSGADGCAVVLVLLPGRAGTEERKRADAVFACPRCEYAV